MQTKSIEFPKWKVGSFVENGEKSKIRNKKKEEAVCPLRLLPAAKESNGQGWRPVGSSSQQHRHVSNTHGCQSRTCVSAAAGRKFPELERRSSRSVPRRRCAEERGKSSQRETRWLLPQNPVQATHCIAMPIASAGEREKVK